MEDMKKQFLDMMSEMSEQIKDCRNNPNYASMLALRNNIVEKGIKPDVAEAVVANMEISVSMAVACDKVFMDLAIDGMGDVIVDYYTEMHRDFTYPDDMIKSIAREFSMVLDF